MTCPDCARNARAARIWKLAAKALRAMLIMRGARKSFYRPRWQR